MKPAFPGILLLSVITLFTAVSCSHPFPDEGISTTVFRYNEAAGISSLDPAFARDQANIWATNQLFNGLVQLNSRLTILPCIAHSWEIAPDGKTYTFHLRRDVFFHDHPVFPGGKGRGVIAKDFIYSFNRILDPKTASPGAWVFNSVCRSGFEAPDDTTLVIRLDRSYPPFLGILTTQYCDVVPWEVVALYGSDFRKHPVGTGPFCFRVWKEGVKLVMVKNRRYFEKEYGKRLPYLEAVSVTFIPDKQSAFLEFMKGKLDLMSGIDPSYKDELLTREGKLKSRFSGKLSMVTQPYLNTEYLGFLMDPAKQIIPNDPVRSRKIRQAINCAFDRHKMIRYLRNDIGYPGINGIVPRGMNSYDSSAIYYDYNPDLARRLLSEAGFPGGGGLPVITLSTTSDYLDLCKYIQHQVEEIGITMKIEVIPPAALKEMKAMAKVPFFRASWIADYPDPETYLSLFYGRNFSPKGPNYTHFYDPRYDRLYEEAMQTISDSLRLENYKTMEAIMMDKAPVIVLYYDQVLRFVSRRITGLGSDPMNLLTLKRVRKY
jgi:oligopeptide transport system substrate-binding protein